MIVAADTRQPITRHRASPRARRLLREAGIQESDVVGSGPEGRILSADVEPVVAAAQTAIVPDHRVEAPRPEPTERPAPAAVAPAFMAVELDFFGIDRVRGSAGGESIGHLAYVARAVVDALADFPYLNAQLGDQTVVVTRPVHLGIAVDLAPDGLVAPVLRDADSLRLAAMARRIDALTSQARTGDLDPGDSDGATFAISDSGPHDTLLTAPILGPAQVASLAVGAVRARPVAIEREHGEYVVAVHPVGTLGLSFVQRAIHSGYAAGFLDAVRIGLETRDWPAEH